jgi:hypothetical protein
LHTANFPARPEAREQHGASRQPRAVTRLVLVHPSLVVRAGLGSLLTGSGLVGSVSPCASIADAVRQGGRPDLVLFVVNRSSAREAAQVAADLWPTARRVALAEGDIDEAAACLSAGVASS